MAVGIHLDNLSRLSEYLFGYLIKISAVVQPTSWDLILANIRAVIEQTSAPYLTNIENISTLFNKQQRCDLYFVTLLLLLLLLLKKVVNARLGGSDLHSISPKNPAPQHQPIE